MTLTINIHNTEETRENGFVNRWPLQTNESITLQQFQVMLPLFAAKEMYLFALNTIYFTIRKKSRSTNELLTWFHTMSFPLLSPWVDSKTDSRDERQQVKSSGLERHHVRDLSTGETAVDVERKEVPKGGLEPPSVRFWSGLVAAYVGLWSWMLWYFCPTL